MTPLDDLDLGRCPDCGSELEYDFNEEAGEDTPYCPDCDRYFEEWEL